MLRHRISALAVTALLVAVVGSADDKDLLKNRAAPPNLLIIFGNSQTLQQPILGSTSAWDGDADSPASKMGAAKRVVKQFVNDRKSVANIGLSTFAHNPNVGSVRLYGKHWIYAPLTTDFPSEPWREPAGTINRWGRSGEGPCTNRTVPSCIDRSPAYITLADSRATVVGPFFGPLGIGSAYIYLNGSASTATKRIKWTIKAGKYGDAFTDGTLATYTIGGTHSIEVTKEYQEKVLLLWVTRASTPNGNPGTVVVNYAPPADLPTDLFYTSGSDAGKAVGFLSDPVPDFDVDANCSGWQFQVNSSPQPLIKIPRDYAWGNACNLPQDSSACVSRLLRPQAKLVHYDQLTGLYTTVDPDNPGYTGVGSKYADGCDQELLGADDALLDVAENQVVLTTRNGSQAPIKNLLVNIFDYVNDPSIDGFQAGKRTDDPDAACRTTAVILVYDNFNGCQNDSCSYLTSTILTRFKDIKVPVFVIGFGASAFATMGTGVCIAQNTGASVDGIVGYFPVTSPEGLYRALDSVLTVIGETKSFGASTVAGAQASGEQMAYFASFNATADRSIWNGRLNGYRLDSSGNLQFGQRTIKDPLDPSYGKTLPAPSNDPSSLIWNAGQNLAQTPGTGATNASAILAPGAPISTGSYLDDSNDTTRTIRTRFYPGRKVVFALPQGYASPVQTLPIPNSNNVPEARYDMTYTTSASWWSALKALLGPQTSPPAVLSPPLADADAGNSLRFIWGDRDAVMFTYKASQRYQGLKLGDIFHSSPLLVGRPTNFAYYMTNLHDYSKFLDTYRTRRRVLYFGANDGLFHAIDAGVWDRDRSVCEKQADGTDGHCHDLGTGAELFAFAPRSIMQTYKIFKDTVGPQYKRIEYSVDGPPTAADVFIDASHSGSPTAADRAWHTVLVGGMREGSNFQGSIGATTFTSQGSYFALDVTQPDELTVDADGNAVPPSAPGTFVAPRCLNAGGDPSCGKDASDPVVRAGQPARAWPTVLWEITDVGDLDVAPSPGSGYPDMGETWSKPVIGRVRICTANCGRTTAPLPSFAERYVAIFGGGFSRQRLNRHGNWLYMVDVETGRTLYRANSSCGVNSGGGGCTPTYFASIPSEPTALDFQGDGYLDRIYVGDLKGQLWRIDLSDLRMLASPPAGRFDNQLDFTTGSGKPFLLFRAPQPTAPATVPYYPIYLRPLAVSLGYSTAGGPALGIGFGTGDRDDILSRLDPANRNTKQRYYYVVDDGNTVTRTESDLMDIASPTAAAASSVPANGWYLEFVPGERLITDSLAVSGVLYFGTFNPADASGPIRTCSNGGRCALPTGEPRFYRVLHLTGDPYLGSDRGEAQADATFLSEPVFYMSKDQQGEIVYSTENTIKKEDARESRRTNVRSWKEKSRRP